MLQEARLEGETLVLSADAVIVGSGAGGGVTAALLAEAGAKVQPPLPSASQHARLAWILFKHDLFDPVTESLCPGSCPSGTWAKPEHDDAFSIDAESLQIVLPLPHRACAFITSCSLMPRSWAS